MSRLSFANPRIFLNVQNKKSKEIEGRRKKREKNIENTGTKNKASKKARIGERKRAREKEKESNGEKENNREEYKDRKREKEIAR
ncbi:hypothetical protein FHG87_003900 [Trinorchestia longiramus]|nr:hypothetical protein FHG87_003900 [Trinorchestia longiramus]